MSGDTKIKSMGAIPHTGGVGFRVWAPHAKSVSVIGSFNDWDATSIPCRPRRTATGTPTLPRLVSAISTATC